MAYATWWRGDALPTLRPLPGFAAGIFEDAARLAQLARLETAEVEARLAQGHRPYVATLDGVPVAYGWVATRTAHIGELDVTLQLPARERYLWDFATLPAWRGRGVYPHLLQAILATEQATADRFWIIAAPENEASSAGIAKAGFEAVAHLSFQRTGEPGLVAVGTTDRIHAAAALLRLPVLEAESPHALAPCWHCAIDARQDGRDLDDLACWPAPSELLVSACTC